MTSTAQPNVLFIAVDDLRPFLGCYGDVNAHTPNIDALARRGVTFTNAMCTAPSCGPSRAALLTGRYPSHTGLYGFQNWAGREEFAHYVTLPEFMRQGGYRTFASGKIHHDSKIVHALTRDAVDANLASDDPDPGAMVARADREWDVNHVAALRGVPYAHTPVAADCINWSGRPLAEAVANPKLLSGPSDDDVMACQDGVTARFGIDSLKRDHDRPFFLALGFVRPHLPFIAPRRYFEPYPLEELELHPVKDDDLADQPWAARRCAHVHDDIRIRQADPQQGRRRVIQAYYACASFLDDMVGRVLSALDESGQRDNTVIAFWSDHGWHLGEKRAWRKFTLWEESARTPMIVVDPRRPDVAGRACSRPVGLIDLYPTIAELTGMEIPDGLDGTSLRPLMDDPDADGPALCAPEFTMQGRGNYSLRDETWRYTRYFDGSEELFNHVEDPYEWTNLADRADADEVKRRFVERLPDFAQPTAGPSPVWCWADQDKDDVEEFRTGTWPGWLEQADPPLV